MTLSHEDPNGEGANLLHPYWYGCVVHIFHVNVYCTDAAPGTPASCSRCMDVLWVCWFSLDPITPFGFKAKQHPRVGFVPPDDSIPFGFLDPAVVIQGSHIIPLPAMAIHLDFSPPSIAQHGQNVYKKPEYHHQDYQYYMVNMYTHLS